MTAYSRCLLLLLPLSGCARLDAPQSVPLPVFSASAAAAPQDGSLFSPGRPPRFISDLRARDVGDIITVRIIETSSASRKAATDTKRASSIEAGVDGFFGLESKIPMGPTATGQVSGGLTNKFKGAGETSGQSTMSASISMRVADVLPNGNLVVAGSRKVKINSEEQTIFLTGVVRPSDVSPDNIVLSSCVADARIEYYGRGTVGDKQSPGWLARVVDWVWPF
ncbi:MAG: flagellar basal body L-ring protein FlgH [Pseudomonadota bacterium]